MGNDFIEGYFKVNTIILYNNSVLWVYIIK